MISCMTYFMMLYLDFLDLTIILEIHKANPHTEIKFPKIYPYNSFDN